MYIEPFAAVNETSKGSFQSAFESRLNQNETELALPSQNHPHAWAALPRNHTEAKSLQDLAGVVLIRRARWENGWVYVFRLAKMRVHVVCRMTPESTLRSQDRNTLSEAEQRLIATWRVLANNARGGGERETLTGIPYTPRLTLLFCHVFDPSTPRPVLGFCRQARFGVAAWPVKSSSEAPAQRCTVSGKYDRPCVRSPFHVLDKYFQRCTHTFSQ